MKVQVLEFEEKFTEGVEELYNTLGWKFSPKLINIWKSLRNYSKVLIALSNGRVVGKVTLDVAFPPYAEIVNLIVHPEYQGKGIGTKLIEECIKISESKGHNIQFLMTEYDNTPALNLYKKFNFYPAILSKRKQLWLFRFGKGSFVEDFLKAHPLFEFKVSRKTVNFHGEKFYEISFADIMSNAHLKIYFKGQPGQEETMPRIAGISFMEGKKAFDLVAYENPFELGVFNYGEDSRFEIEPLSSKGLEVFVEKQILKLSKNQNERVKIDFKKTGDFDTPLDYLSFRTIVASFKINENFVISIGEDCG
ncbi:GNAT family N-acetyltransferase [Thermococcus argininiproducens]|uniref:GNAT family N-acetyltransferase n=1 Tax=Thermococcus argininiproducens TaxID=2866384 RepID=A0A9E7MA75_9EURY|nr:GNAT family N-acetyltransferase [Thermococcus argininiproducens]USG99541.1 GNAT family N-acetyltransferase [Thermococcus argininiproducens]